MRESKHAYKIIAIKFSKGFGKGSKKKLRIKQIY